MTFKDLSLNFKPHLPVSLGVEDYLDHLQEHHQKQQ